MAFTPYIAKDRYLFEHRFDFRIANETGKSWYDGSQNQWMAEREWCVKHLKKGMTVVDCGAHHGMLSVIFSKVVGDQGKVFAYEALPSNASVIQENAQINSLRNIIVRPVGVGASNGMVSIISNASNTVVVHGENGTSDAENEKIRIVRLDDDLQKDTKVDFLKIDVEGFDLYALQGMPETLGQAPILDLEIHNFLFKDVEKTLTEILKILAPLRYEWTILGEISGEPVSAGKKLSVQDIIVFNNPHLFGVPLVSTR